MLQDFKKNNQNKKKNSFIQRSRAIFLTLVGVMFIFFLVNFASAFEFDNVKSYDPIKKEITIKNAFGLGKDIAKVKLNTPIVYNVIRGKDRLVAEFTINNFEDYSNVFNNMEFYDIKNNMKKFDRGFNYKYKTFYDVNVFDYEIICKEKLLTNGSIEKYDCEQKQTGSHIEKRIKWIDFNEKAELLKGEITLGIFTNVLPNEKVEWIPTLFGVKINEWAVWTEGLNVNLADYYYLESNEDYINGNHNLTVQDGQVNFVSGLIGNASQFSDSESMYIGWTNPNENWDFNSTSMTINFWLNKTDNTGNQVMFSKRAAGVGWFWFDNAGTYNFQEIASAPLTVARPTLGEWHMYTIMKNTTHTSLWVDGVWDEMQTNGGVSNTGINVSMGDGGAVGETNWHGLMDELGVWNRTLTASEISDLWNGGAGINPTDIFSFTIDLISPINALNTSNVNLSFEGNFTIQLGNFTNATLQIYNSSNDLYKTNFTTITGNYTNSSNLSISNIADGNYSWNYYVCGLNSSGGTGCDVSATNRTFTINTIPDIHFINPTPTDYTNISINSFIVNVSLTETYFSNLTFNLYNSSGLYNSTTFTDSTRQLNWSEITDGVYTYNSTILTTTNQQNTTATRNITIDTTAPEINITYPIDHVTYHITGTNLTLNWTVSDNNLDSCWYNYNRTNISLTCADNTTSFNVTNSNNKNLTFYANDTFGNLNEEFRSWDFYIFENSMNFSSETIEGATETFILNITKSESLSISAINLNYNGTNNLAAFSGANNILATIDITIPNVNANTTITFYWQILLSNTTIINSFNNTQLVQNISLDDCSVYTNEIYNYTLIDEETQDLLTGNTSIELNIEIFSLDRSVKIINYSNLFNITNPVRLCLNLPLNNTKYKTDSIIKYSSTNYAIEYYNIINFTLENSTIPQRIYLYDLNSTDSTEFQLTFTGSDFLPVENALVYINRQYIEEAQFKTVELPKTDSNGQTILHLVRNDIIYNFIITKGGVVIGTFNNLIAFCDDYTIGDCKISLNAFSAVEDIYNQDVDTGITYTNPSYNETSREVSFSFVSTDGSEKTILMNVTRNDIFGNRSVCQHTLISPSGTLECTVGANVDDSVLKIEIYVDESQIIYSSVQIDKSNYGVGGYLVFFIMAISFILLFSESKTGVLIGMFLSFVCAIGLNMITGNLIGLGASGIWLILIVILGIWKLNKERIQ